MKSMFKNIHTRERSAPASRAMAYALRPSPQYVLHTLLLLCAISFVAYCFFLYTAVHAAAQRQSIEWSLPEDRARLSEQEGVVMAQTARIDRTYALSQGFVDASETYVVRAVFNQGLSLGHAI